MSIEKDLTRIADALEMICAYVKGGVAQASVPEKAAPVAKTLVPAASVPPLDGGAKAGIGAFVPPGVTTQPPATTDPVATTPAPTTAWPQTPEELRLMAQRIAQKCGPKTLEFTQWVNGILVPYGVKTLVTLPADKIVEVAMKLDEYRKKAGINV